MAVLKRRLVGATGYALQGLKACFLHEEAFRIEVICTLVLLPVAIFVADSAVELVLLMGSILFVLIVELLNSAVEATVDRISDERHELAGRAKDLGAAAVMLSISLFFLTWGCILLL
ncbi:MAG: diacylglycerol kinase [Pseudomonadales bacterium]|nr:diacylglycerol kinase [Pseudomonadales bacterium]MCP5173244.1 diacylglycerol kinase [Pseudomonadales bacterium]